VTGPEQHAATVREVLPKPNERHRVDETTTYVYGSRPWNADKVDAAYAALDELVALAGRADELQAKYDKDVKSAMGAAERFRAQGIKDKARADELQREATEANALAYQRHVRIDELQRERDEARDKYERLRQEVLGPFNDEPIPPQDIERAAQLAKERGWNDKQGRREAVQLRAALEDLLSNVGGHNHWDSTMRYGAGCVTCIRQREAKERARAALAGVPERETAESNDIDKAIWLCALDRVPIEERVEWTRRMRRQYDEIALAGVQADCDHDFVFVNEGEYRCDRCGIGSRDGVRADSKDSA
jgi:hypothetical protein